MGGVFHAETPPTYTVKEYNYITITYSSSVSIYTGKNTARELTHYIFKWNDFMSAVSADNATFRTNTNSIFSTVVVQKVDLMGGAIGGARFELGERYGCVASHAIGGHVNDLKTPLTVDPRALTTLNGTQCTTFFTKRSGRAMPHAWRKEK